MLLKLVARFGLVFAIGAQLYLLAGDLRDLDSYSDIWTYPAVGAGILMHLGSILMAYGVGHAQRLLRAQGDADAFSAETVARLSRL